MSIRERLDSLSRGELAGLVIVVVATLLGAGLWYMRSLPRPVDIAAPADAVSPVVSPVAGADGVAVAESRIDHRRRRRMGAAARCVRVRVGRSRHRRDRTAPAVPRKRRRPHRVEPRGAADRRDADRRPEARRDDEPATRGRPAPGRAGGTTLININSASETELEALPGVGPVTAAAIIDYRTQNGPFATVDDLIDVTGIGPSTLEQIRPVRHGMNAWALPAAAAAFWAGLLAWEVRPSWARPWMGMALGLAGARRRVARRATRVDGGGSARTRRASPSPGTWPSTAVERTAERSADRRSPRSRW